MQKIIIKNFRAIEYAEIELKKVLVLIGEQATGKSTIAKLIYFFKTIQDDFFNYVYETGSVNLEEVVKVTFRDFFGFIQLDFEIEFQYRNDKKIIIRQSNNQINIEALNILDEKNIKSLQNDFEQLKQIKDERKSDLANRKALIRLEFEQRRDLSRNIDKLFNALQRDKLYVIAGRNVTVSYSEIFNQYLDTKIQLEIRTGQKRNDSTDEKLMLKFIEHTKLIKDIYLILKEEVTDISNDKKKEILYNKFSKKYEYILKAKYKISEESDEQLILENGKSIALSDASSGQQEVIRILQDLLFLIFDNQKFLRIIEEPEAHLFPITQKELIELLALAVNYQPENQLIIATHSPNILTVFNNLLFANRVVEKNPDAKGGGEAIVEEDFWLKAEDFSAYALGRDDDD
ncbi:MAG: AAA family ATPase, partial [Saprospiraceae bacterium]